MRLERPILVLGMCALGLGGCKDDEKDYDSDTSGNDDTGTETVADGWTIERVEEVDAGIQIDLAVSPVDEIALAYYVTAPVNTGLCTEANEEAPPPRLQQTIRLARKGLGEATWRTEVVDEPIVYASPTGLALAYDGAGNPAVAYTGGPAVLTHCGSNDAMLSEWVGGAWSQEAVVTDSGQAAAGLAISDSGNIVGYWPGLAYDTSGNPALIYKDVHFGTKQSMDAMSADVEFAWRQGGWSHEPIDFNSGAGDYSDIVFDAEGRPVAVYIIDVEAEANSRRGVCASRRETDGTWTRVQLQVGYAHQRVSAAVDPLTGELAVAFYAPLKKAATVKRLLDPAKFADSKAWQSEPVGEVMYDEGYYPSLAYAPTGELLLAHHRCKEATVAAAGCNPAHEAVVLARRGTGGTWRSEVVRSAGKGSCGEFTRVAVDSSGEVHIAYRCTVEINSEFEFRVFVAHKPLGE